MMIVFFLRGPMPRKDIDSSLHKCRRNVVLGGQHVAARRIYFRSSRFQHAGKVAGLGLQMDGYSHFQPLKRLCLLKITADAPQHRHMLFYPGDLTLSRGCQADISDFTHILYLHISHKHVICTFFRVTGAWSATDHRQHSESGLLNTHLICTWPLYARPHGGRAPHQSSSAAGPASPFYRRS